MENFWKWFTEKTGFTQFAWVNHNRENWMANLIGHMEEYIALHGYNVGFRSDIFIKMHNGENFIDIRFNDLTDVIEKRCKG